MALFSYGVELGSTGVEPGDAGLGGVDRTGERGLANLIDGDKVGFEDDGGAIA